MTSTIDPKTIGKPSRPRRHVRTLTGMWYQCSLLFRGHTEKPLGYLPETDASGKEKWPKGEEKVWKAGMRSLDKGMQFAHVKNYFNPLIMLLLRRRRIHFKIDCQSRPDLSGSPAVQPW